MRTSRLSRDTTHVFGTVATAASTSSSLPSSPPRRVTRLSLARFSYDSNSAAPVSTAITDIEDAVRDDGSSGTRAELTRKRKRAPSKRAKNENTSNTSTTTAAAKPRASSTRRKPIKEEKTEMCNLDGQIKDEETDAEGNGPVPQPRSKPASPRKRRQPARSTTDPVTGSVTVTPPSDWESIYEILRAMRKPGGAAYPAAVDTMGCERLADPAASPREQRLHTLVALMLSSQTKDTANAMVMRRLQTTLPASDPSSPSESKPGLNLSNLLAVPLTDLQALLYGVGFHNNKARFLKRTAEILRDDFDSDIPSTFSGLTSLPGVGPKMAHLCLTAAWGRTEGIGVDVHVHRITNLWGWHGDKTPTKQPEDTRKKLESWLPRDRWHEINTLLVGLGQTICLPQGRKCGDCDVGLAGLCRAADRAKLGEGRRRREAMTAATAIDEVYKKEEEEAETKDVKIKVEDKEN